MKKTETGGFTAVMRSAANRTKETSMKRTALLAAAFFVSAAAAFAQSAIVTLDESIKNAAREIENRLPRDTRVAVMNFNSPSDRLSNYVIDELIGALIDGGKVLPVERQKLTLVEEEMDFQMSGEVSDESAQEFGRKLAAQSIVSGSFEDKGRYYRATFRVIQVESAAIQALARSDVKKDNALAALMGSAFAKDSEDGGLIIGARLGGSFWQSDVIIVQENGPDKKEKYPAGFAFTVYGGYGFTDHMALLAEISGSFFSGPDNDDNRYTLKDYALVDVACIFRYLFLDSVGPFPIQLGAYLGPYFSIAPGDDMEIKIAPFQLGAAGGILASYPIGLGAVTADIRLLADFFDANKKRTALNLAVGYELRF